MSRGKPCFISIHAPRTGSDPCSGVDIWLREISIHAPRTGSDDFLKCRVVVEVVISIHAPRTGSDVREADVDGQLLDFNPRSPHGERQLFRPFLHAFCLFQSTLPARGATHRFDKAAVGSVISIHAPRTGSDMMSTRRSAFAESDFNPRSPHGERLRKVTILSIRIIDFAQKVYHKTVLLRISLAENAVILPEKPRNPVRTSLQKAGGLRFARAIRAAHPYSISSPSGA